MKEKEIEKAAQGISVKMFEKNNRERVKKDEEEAVWVITKLTMTDREEWVDIEVFKCYDLAWDYFNAEIEKQETEFETDSFEGGGPFKHNGVWYYECCDFARKIYITLQRKIVKSKKGE